MSTALAPCTWLRCRWRRCFVDRRRSQKTLSLKRSNQEVAPMADRRNAPRGKTYKVARIAFGGNRAVIGCLVRNLSEAGACLAVESQIDIPDRFNLVFDSGQSSRTCCNSPERALQPSRSGPRRRKVFAAKLVNSYLASCAFQRAKPCWVRAPIHSNRCRRSGTRESKLPRFSMCSSAVNSGSAEAWPVPSIPTHISHQRGGRMPRILPQSDPGCVTGPYVASKCYA
jgi:hypothetical protein